MAATVTGAFVVLDRASRPIRKIRNEALQADAAVKSLGDSLDRIGTRQQVQMMGNTTQQIRMLGAESRVAGGHAETLADDVDRIATPQRTRNIADQAGAITQTGRAARDADRPVSQLTRGVRSLGNESEKSRGRLARFGASVFGLRQALILGLIPAIGLAAQGISALGGGIVALLPKFASLAGVVAPMATTFTGLGLAMITAKVAFKDLGKAMGGNEEAMKKLTPEAKSFIKTLKQYQPTIEGIRKSAQKGLFPGLEVAVRRLNAAAPIVNQLVQGMGARLGTLAASAARKFTGQGFLRDLQMIGDQGMHVVTQLGRSLINLASGIRHVLVAGLPLTHWLSDTVLKWSQTFEQTMKIRRENGQLAQSFVHTRETLEQMGRIVRNLFGWWRGVMHAATGTGNQLWESIDRTTKRWADWSNSAKGQHDMRKYFASLRAPLHEIAGFVGDLTKALGQMGKQRGFTEALHALRGALPAVGKGLSDLAGTLGPAMFQMLAQVLTLASTLVGGAGGEGPLMLMLNTLNGVLATVNSLVSHIPGLGAVFAGAFTILALRRFADGVSDLARRWLGVAGAARQATAAQAQATAAGMGGGGMIGPARGPVGPGGKPGGGGLPAGGAVPTYMDAYRTNVGGAIKNVEEGQRPHYMDAYRQNMQAGMNQSRGVGWLRRRAPGRLSRGLGRVGTGIRAAGRGLGTGGRLAGGFALRGAGAAAGFMAPVMLLSGVGGVIATQPTRGGGAGAAQRALGGVDAMTFGLTSGLTHRNDMFTSQAEFDQRSIKGLGTNINRSLRGMGGDDPTLKQAKQQVQYLKNMQEVSSHDTDEAGKKLYRSISQRLTQARRQLKTQAEMTGSTLAIGFGQAFNVYSRRMGMKKAMDLTAHDVTQKMKSLGPEGKKALAQNMIEWAREQARANPKLWGKVKDLEDQIKDSFTRTGRHIKIVNGQILDGSAGQWKSISAAMTSPVEVAKARMQEQFTAIQREAMSALVLMGYDRGTARNIVAGMEKGGATGKVASSLASNKDLANNPGASGALGLAQKGQKGGGAGLASGGRLPGLGMSDTVRLAHGGYGAPGELVVNRHTEASVNRDLAHAGKAPLGSRVQSESRPHYMATGDRMPMNLGVKAAQSNAKISKSYGGVSGALATLIQELDAQGFRHGSTTGGKHAATSLHYSGSAVDYGDASNDMRALWSVVYPKRKQFAELFGPNYLTPPTLMHYGKGFSDAALQADHNDHIHIGLKGALTGALGSPTGVGGAGGAAAQIALKRYASGRGVPAALATAGMNAYAKGLEGKINAALGAGGGGGPPTKGAMSFNAVARLAESVGLPGVTFAQIARGESGFNPSAVGHDPGGTQGLGLWQITTGFNDDVIAQFGGRQAMFNARTNALAAKAIYDRQGIGAWYGTKYMTGPNLHYKGATGTRIPGFGGWFGRGGSGTVKGASFIGVGEGNSPEHVQITPAVHHAGQGGAATGGGKQIVVNVHPGAIVIHGGGAKAGREAADAFMEQLADLVHGMSLESEGAVS